MSGNANEYVDAGMSLDSSTPMDNGPELMSAGPIMIRPLAHATGTLLSRYLSSALTQCFWGQFTVPGGQLAGTPPNPPGALPPEPDPLAMFFGFLTR